MDCKTGMEKSVSCPTAQNRPQTFASRPAARRNRSVPSAERAPYSTNERASTPSSDKNSCVLKSDMNASNAMHGTASFQTTVVSACLSPGPRMSARNSAQPAAIRITV